MNGTQKILMLLVWRTFDRRSEMIILPTLSPFNFSFNRSGWDPPTDLVPLLFFLLFFSLLASLLDFTFLKPVDIYLPIFRIISVAFFSSTIYICIFQILGGSLGLWNFDRWRRFFGTSASSSASLFF